MQPKVNTIWFAKMKESKKTKISKIINTYLNSDIPFIYKRHKDFSFVSKLRKVYKII